MNQTKEFKKRKTFSLRLTKLELVHLRDMLSILLPPDGSKTISQSLAELEGRTVVENMLWNKLADVCEEAELPLDEDAPDYMLAPTGSPPLSVFQIASEPQEMSDDAEEAGPKGFVEEE